ncbi:MAG: hypothetical protein DRJ05_01855 [Bacteroidetes bacterium]|nr:MAG: hypothetical protein DRJ05_01855 [Bacteroidota bacterium]
MLQIGRTFGTYGILLFSLELSLVFYVDRGNTDIIKYLVGDNSMEYLVGGNSLSYLIGDNSL